MSNASKFVIVGTPRTGSTFLQHLLNSHPDIICQGEILKRRHWKRWKDQGDAVSMFERDLWNDENMKSTAVGFKMICKQADVFFPEVWTYLVHHDIKIIHLTRRNMLDMVLSKKLSMRHHYAVAYSTSRCYHIPVMIAPYQLNEAFATIEAAIKGVRERFSDERRFEIAYEDFYNNLDHLDPLQRFLGVDPARLSTRTVKLRVKSQREMVTNYDELKAAFTDSPYYSFFED